MSESTQYRFRVTQSDDVEVTSEGEILELQLRSVSSTTHGVAFSERVGRHGSQWSYPFSATDAPISFPQFVIAKGSETLATIQCTHLLRTRYVISVAGGATWVFRMPLFRAHYSGSSIQGCSLYVRMWQENLWDLLVDVDQSSLEMLTAIACIFLARWQST